MAGGPASGEVLDMAGVLVGALALEQVGEEATLTLSADLTPLCLPEGRWLLRRTGIRHPDMDTWQPGTDIQ